VAVGESRENPRDLLEGVDLVRTTGGTNVLARTQCVDHRDGRGRGLVIEELPVGHDDGRVVARRIALEALEGDASVGGRLVVPDAKVRADCLPDGVATHDGAQRVGADTDAVVTVGKALVLGVERRHPADLGTGQAQGLGAELDAAGRDVAVDALHQVQQRQQCRPLLRVAPDDLLGIRAELLELLCRVGLRRTGRVGAVVGAICVPAHAWSSISLGAPANSPMLVSC